MPSAEFPIIRKLGGRQAVTEKLHARGHDIGFHALRMWVNRGTIPGDAVPHLMAIAEAERVDYGAKDFELASEPDEAGSSGSSGEAA